MAWNAGCNLVSPGDAVFMLTQPGSFAPEAVSGTSPKALRLLRKRLRGLWRASYLLPICLAVAALALAVWWLTRLNGLPDIGDPFYVGASHALRTPDDRDNLLASGVQAEKDNQPLLAADRDRFIRFERQLDQLRALLKIPGLSAAVVRDQEVVWDKGFGFADREKRVLATPETPYHVASLTKTFAATLILRLVEQGKLDLEEPACHYSAAVKDDRIKIRHLLTHTFEGTPGERFHYTAAAYWLVNQVIEKAYGKPFRELMVATFLEPLQMDRSVPGHDMLTKGERWADRLGKEASRRYREVLKDLARPYHLDGSGEAVANPPYRADATDAGEGLTSIDAREGLISTVRDLAKYDAAIDRHQFLRQETQERAWTPAFSSGGHALPHGLGWFAQRYRGLKLVWHYGYWPNNFSALLLKVPEKNVTLILLANSDGLSAPFFSDNNDVETSAFASCFLRLFVFEDGSGRIPPDPTWVAGRQEFARELARLRKRSGYSFRSEELSQAAMTKWLADGRARVRTP
jgi:CubicO group peptidase (beta-lactamase class C family)